MCGSIFKTPTTQVNNSICNISCSGNSTQTCGGFIGSTYYVSVYSTSYNKTTYNCKLILFLRRYVCLIIFWLQQLELNSVNIIIPSLYYYYHPIAISLCPYNLTVTYSYRYDCHTLYLMQRYSIHYLTVLKIITIYYCLNAL